MKLLFLDVDGVLNCSKTKVRFGPFLGIDQEKADLVKKIVNETGCKVILSSTWRRDNTHLREVQRVLDMILDCTPILPGERRGVEVGLFLAHQREAPKAIAILDDGDQFLPNQKADFFQTDFYGDGLTEDIAQKVIAHLNREVPPEGQATPQA